MFCDGRYRLACTAEVEPIDFAEGRHHVIEGCGDRAACCLGWAIGPGPDIRGIFDFFHVLTEPDDCLFPVDRA